MRTHTVGGQATIGRPKKNLIFFSTKFYHLDSCASPKNNFWIWREIQRKVAKYGQRQGIGAEET